MRYITAAAHGARQTKEVALKGLRPTLVILILSGLVWGCATPGPFSKASPPAQAPVETPPLTAPPADPAPNATAPKPVSPEPTDAPPAVDSDPGTPGEKADAAPAEPPDGSKEGQSAMDEALDFCQVGQDFWQKGDLENALEALDQAYSLILDAEVGNPKLIQQKEDLRFLIAKRILEIYASRHIVVNGNHKAIPRSMNQHVQDEIKRFTNGERAFFVASYKRAGRYRPMILKALKEAGLPEELSWLPLIESGFKVQALSRARALGLWQFIPSTGYKFGLKRNMYIDERIDPEKATRAAVAYLKELHQIFGDWTTVLAAYNCGEGRVLRVIRSQNVNYLDNFWDLYERLPRETARYVPRFLATLHIIANPDKYGMKDLTADPPMAFNRVTITRRVHLKNVAKVLGMPESELRALNPELRYQITPEESYSLRVPKGMEALLTARLEQIPTSSKPHRPFIYHKVRSGETLSTIARRYRSNIRSIAAANNIRRAGFIVAGKTLKIPLRGQYVSKPVAQKRRTASGDAVHVVKSGDSLWILAQRYGTTTRKIQAANGLKGTTLSIGQRLRIPGNGTKITTVKGMKVYEVKRGDSPFKIAQKHRMSLNHFLQANRLTPRSKIYPGQTVYVE